MTFVKRIDYMEAYNRAVSGPKVPESEWDFKIIPQTAAKMKEKYKIKLDKKVFILTDRDLMERLFQAGKELLATTGVYCIDTGRVIEVKEEEIDAAVRGCCRFALIGEGRDAVELRPRGCTDSSFPIIQGGPTGAPVSEDVFIQMHESYAKEPFVDTIVNGVLQTINGNDPRPGSATEIAAVKSEIMMIRTATARVGRPGMGL